MPPEATPRPRKWRRLLGLMLLGCVVFLWTASSFLQSAVFADNEFNKPYFVTYFNTCFFILPLLPLYLKHVWRRRGLAAVPLSRRASTNRSDSFRSENSFAQRNARENSPSRVLLKPNDGGEQAYGASGGSSGASSMLDERPDFEDSDSGFNAVYAHMTTEPPLTLRQTAQLAFKFCVLWFMANWFNSACLGYTTVASATILTSSSSIFTLIFSSLARVEKFTYKKLVGVLTLFVGVIVTSMEDISGKTDEGRGLFPHKDPWEVALGDILALLSAALYGIYATGLAKTIGDESRINMIVFFGFVGSINLIMLWPGFFILHFTGIETFVLPSTRMVTGVVLTNAVVSMLSDICWAYAMVMVSPLVVTVGLSLTIPLSLVGQMIINQQHASPVYWIGAIIVVLSFLFINNESKKTREAAERAVAQGT